MLWLSPKVIKDINSTRPIITCWSHNTEQQINAAVLSCVLTAAWVIMSPTHRNMLHMILICQTMLKEASHLGGGIMNRQTWALMHVAIAIGIRVLIYHISCLPQKPSLSDSNCSWSLTWLLPFANRATVNWQSCCVYSCLSPLLYQASPKVTDTITFCVILMPADLDPSEVHGNREIEVCKRALIVFQRLMTMLSCLSN